MLETPHERAIKALTDLGASVLRDRNAPGHPVIEVDLGRSMVTDAVLEHLINLNSFRNLFLDKTLVTDRIMEVLRVHPEIRELNIDETNITDDGLMSLCYAKGLELLFLGANITDGGFSSIQTVATLTTLGIADTKVTDAGLRYVEGCRQLEHIFVGQQHLTETGIGHLKRLSRLKIINVNAEVADTVLKQLRGAFPDVRIDF